MEAPPPTYNALFKPCEFDYEDDAWDTVWEFAREHMFAIMKHDIKPNRKIWACSKSGSPDQRNKKKGLAPKYQREGRSKKTQCQWKVEARRKDGQWHVQTLHQLHNHPPGLWLGDFPEYRLDCLDQDEILQILTLYRSGQQPSQILSYLGQENPECTLIPRDISNLIADDRSKTLAGRRPIERLLDQLSKEEFRFRVDVKVWCQERGLGSSFRLTTRREEPVCKTDADYIQSVCAPNARDDPLTVDLDRSRRVRRLLILPVSVIRSW